jgi:hypothetical protein
LVLLHRHKLGPKTDKHRDGTEQRRSAEQNDPNDREWMDAQERELTSTGKNYS